MLLRCSFLRLASLTLVMAKPPRVNLEIQEVDDQAVAIEGAQVGVGVGAGLRK